MARKLAYWLAVTVLALVLAIAVILLLEQRDEPRIEPAAVAAILLGEPAEAAERRATDVTVMTRNVYLGADITKPVLAQTQAEFEQANADLLAEVQRTDFPARAKLLAREIHRARAHLVGLQEVALWRRSPQGVKDGTATPARVVIQDFLKLLRAELRRLGASYRVARVTTEFDYEAPTALGYDARLTIRDVILARSDVRRRNARDGNYRAKTEVQTAGGEVAITRGWNSVDATVGRARLRFVNTHLEAFGAQVRERQAKELVGRRGPMRTKLPIVLAGDLNSDRRAKAPEDRLAYRAVTRAGFVRRATSRHACCNPPELTNPKPAFDHTVDHILTEPRLPLRRSYVTGNTVRTPSGLWPSDHGGIVSVLRFR